MFRENGTWLLVIFGLLFTQQAQGYKGQLRHNH